MKMKNFAVIIIFVFSVAFGCAKKDENGTIVQSDVEVPSTPLNLTALEVAGMINLSWSKNQETDIAKYRLYRNDSTISNSPKINLSPAQKISFSEQGYIEETGTSFADVDVIAGSTYYYRVSVLDNDNNESNKSNQVIVNYKDHTPPAKPVGITALTGSKIGEINLGWTSNTESDLLGYNIYRAVQGGGYFVFISSQSENSYTVRNLTPGDNYFLKVTALDNSNNESEYSDEVICKANGDNVAPEIPANFLALPGTVGKINLSWSANTDPDLAKYMIYRLIGSSYSTINETLDTTYEVTGLTSSIYCYFKISAVDESNNESILSAWARVIVP